MQIKKIAIALTALAVLPMTACIGDKDTYTTQDGTKVKVDRDVTETNVDYTTKDGTTVHEEYKK